MRGAAFPTLGPFLLFRRLGRLGLTALHVAMKIGPYHFAAKQAANGFRFARTQRVASEDSLNR